MRSEKQILDSFMPLHEKEWLAIIDFLEFMKCKDINP